MNRRKCFLRPEHGHTSPPHKPPLPSARLDDLLLDARQRLGLQGDAEVLAATRAPQMMSQEHVFSTEGIKGETRSGGTARASGRCGSLGR